MKLYTKKIVGEIVYKWRWGVRERAGEARANDNCAVLYFWNGVFPLAPRGGGGRPTWATDRGRPEVDW